MPEIKVTVLVEQDGVPIPGFPFTQRVAVEQVAPWSPFFQGASAPGVFTPVPAPSINVLQALVMRPDATILVRFASQTDEGLEIAPNGLLVVLGCNVDDGTALNATVYAQDDVNVRGLAAGAAQ